MNLRYGLANLLLVGCIVIRRLVHHQRSSATTVEEIDAGGLSSLVSGLKAAVEVGQQIDSMALVHAIRVQNTWDQDTIAGLSKPSVTLVFQNCL